MFSRMEIVSGQEFELELAEGPVWRVSSLRRFIDSWERKPGRPPWVTATR